MTTTIIDDIIIREGTTFERNWIYLDTDGNPFDFTGYIIRAQWRRTDTGELLANFGAEFSDRPGGAFKIALTGSGSVGFSLGGSRFDIKVNDLSGSVFRPVEGDVEYSPQVTV